MAAYGLLTTADGLVLLRAEHHFPVPSTEGRRPFRSQRFVLDATITGGELGTVEADGTTDFAQWVPIAEVPRLRPRADIVDVAMSVLQARDG